MTKGIQHLLDSAIRRHGESVVADALERLLLAPTAVETTLTIVANAGLHPLPSGILRGEVFIASQGNLDLSSPASLHAEYNKVLRRIGAKLRERVWELVYLIPTGPPTLSLQIKLLVYQINRLATVDIFYSKGQFAEVSIDHRALLDADVEEGRLTR